MSISQDRQVFGLSAMSSQNRDNISLLGLGHSLTLFLGLETRRGDKGRSQADQEHLVRHLSEMRFLQGLQVRGSCYSLVRGEGTASARLEGSRELGILRFSGLFTQIFQNQGPRSHLLIRL